MKTNLSITLILLFALIFGVLGFLIGQEGDSLSFGRSIDRSYSYHDIIGTEDSPYTLSNGTTTQIAKIGDRMILATPYIYANASGTEKILYQVEYSNEVGCESGGVNWFAHSEPSISGSVVTLNSTSTFSWTSPGAGVHNFMSEPLDINAKCLRMRLWNDPNEGETSASSTDVWVHLKTRN